MSRNSEKHFVGLNRVFLNEQWKRERELKRPPLHKLTTADDVRKWIPSITLDINYYLNQLSGARKHDYPASKFEEFEKKVENLEKEYKYFVKKVFELDPDQKGIPWEPKGYVSKRKQCDDRSDEKPGCSGSKKKKPIVLNVLHTKNIDKG